MNDRLNMDFSRSRSLSLPNNRKVPMPRPPPSYDGIYMEYGANELHKEIHYYLKNLKNDYNKKAEEYTEEQVNDIIERLKEFLLDIDEYLKDADTNYDIKKKDRKRILRKMEGDKKKIKQILRMGERMEFLRFLDSMWTNDNITKLNKQTRRRLYKQNRNEEWQKAVWPSTQKSSNQKSSSQKSSSKKSLTKKHSPKTAERMKHFLNDQYLQREIMEYLPSSPNK